MPDFNPRNAGDDETIQDIKKLTSRSKTSARIVLSKDEVGLSGFEAGDNIYIHPVNGEYSVILNRTKAGSFKSVTLSASRTSGGQTSIGPFALGWLHTLPGEKVKTITKAGKVKLTTE